MHGMDSGTAQYAPAPVPGIDPELLRDSNINPVTLLATDYLNHFVDAATVIEMLPYMPDCFAEIAHWRPRGYCEHFRQSNLRDARIVLAAWRHVPDRVKELFDAVVERLNAVTARAIDTARRALAMGDSGLIERDCARAARELRALIREAGDIVNGSALRRLPLAAAG